MWGDNGYQPVKLSAAQRAGVNAIEFGYDIDRITVPPKAIPKGIVMEWPRGYGKTVLVECTGGAQLVLEPHAYIGYQGLDDDLGKLIKRHISDLLHSDPACAAQIESETVYGIEMKNGAKLDTFAQSETIRGHHFTYLYLDEAAKFKEEIIAGASIYTAQRAGKRWLMLSTPRGGMLDTYFGRKFLQGANTRPVVCRHCKASFDQQHFSGVIFPPDQPNLPLLPSCPSCGANDWEYGVGLYSVIIIDPWDCPFRTKEEIQALLDAEGNTPLARQEILGEFTRSASTVFREEWLRKCTVDSRRNYLLPNVATYYVLGIDFGKVHDSSVIAVGHQQSEKIYLDYMKTREASKVEGQKWDYEDVKDDINDIIKRLHACGVAPDATGVGDSICDAMARDFKRRGLPARLITNGPKHKGFNMGSNKNKVELVGMLEDALATGTLQLPSPQDPEIDKLWKEMLAFSYELTPTTVKYGTQAAHDDRVVALALMVWGLGQNKWMPGRNVLAGKLGEIHDKHEGLQGRRTSVSLATHWSST